MDKRYPMECPPLFLRQFPDLPDDLIRMIWKYYNTSPLVYCYLYD